LAIESKLCLCHFAEERRGKKKRREREKKREKVQRRWKPQPNALDSIAQQPKSATPYEFVNALLVTFERKEKEGEEKKRRG